MRLIIMLALVASFGCKNPAELIAEAVIEKATGNKINIDGETVTIKNEKGETVTIQTKGKDGKVEAVVTDAKGKKALFSVDGDKVKVEGRDGTVEWGTATIPKGFPLQVMGGAKIISSAHANKGKKGEVFQVTLSVEKDPAVVAEFYENELTGKGLKVKRSEHKMDKTHMVILAGRKKKAISAGAHIIRDQGKKETIVSLTWNAK